jgi:hypothetical protein
MRIGILFILAVFFITSPVSVLGATNGNSANAEYRIAFQESFLEEGTTYYQLINGDLDHDQTPDFILTGQNNEAREFFIYWLSVGQDLKPVVKWQSDNLFEEKSIWWVAIGKFTADQEQLLAISDTQLLLYQYEKMGFQLVKQEPCNFTPLNLTSGDLDGDGRWELAIAKIGQITNQIYNSKIQIWCYNDLEDKFVLKSESGLLGNVRGLTAGDLNNDGIAEILVDEGLRFQSGNIHLLKWKDNRIEEESCLKKAIKGAIYAMNIGTFPDRIRLVTASSSGKVNFLFWNNQTLTLEKPEVSFECELISIVVSDLNLDQIPELIVTGYPQQLSILSSGPVDQEAVDKKSN